MVNYADAALFLQDGIGKQIEIAYSGGTITNNELASQDFTLTEKLTSNGSFVLGECNAGMIEFSVGYGTDPLEGEELTVSITPTGGASFQIGLYTVVSDKPTADRRWRKITAYDALYGVLNMDVAAWYDTLFPDTETAHTIKEIRDSFFTHIGLTQEVTDLPNDAVSVTKQMDFKQLTGKTVLNALCEINGCWGRIDRSGTFVYVFLDSPSDPLYPALTLFPADDIFPKYKGNADPTEIGTGGKYISAKYEDYYVLNPSGVQIRTDKNDVGVTVGSGEICVIEGNFLAYGLDAATLTTIATNILEKIEQIYFVPAEIQAQGFPMLEVGDAIILNTRYAKIETYLFQRKMKGIQSLVDAYTAKGTKSTKKNLNSTQSQLINTNGKINEVKADLVTAKKVIADEIEADRARITYIETNYVTTQTLVANYATIASLQTVDGKIDNLTSIAITTQNLSAQTIYGSQITGLTISAGQITSGTIAADRLDASVIRTQFLNACAVDPRQGQLDVGVVRTTQLWIWNGTSYERKF